MESSWRNDRVFLKNNLLPYECCKTEEGCEETVLLRAFRLADVISFSKFCWRYLFSYLFSGCQWFGIKQGRFVAIWSTKFEYLSCSSMFRAKYLKYTWCIVGFFYLCETTGECETRKYTNLWGLEDEVKHLSSLTGCQAVEEECIASYGLCVTMNHTKHYLQTTWRGSHGLQQTVRDTRWVLLVLGILMSVLESQGACHRGARSWDLVVQERAFSGFSRLLMELKNGMTDLSYF